MRHIYLCLTALFLAACSMEGMAEKMIPADIRANTTAHIDALIASDDSLVREAFNIAEDDEEAAKQIEILLSKVPGGTEVQRDIVGTNAQKNLSISVGDGKQASQNYSLSYEVKMSEGYMLVTTSYTLDGAGKCCMLVNINVEDYDSSPALAALKMTVKILKTFGVIVIIGLVALVFFLVRRSRRKKRA